MSEHTREEILKLIEENGGPELLSIPGFEAAFQRAVEQAGSGEVVCFEDIQSKGD